MSTALLLFLIMDSPGNIPIFIAVLRHLEPKRRLRVIVREMLITLVVMLLFLYFGKHLLVALNLRLETLSIAGGLVLFLIALRMIFPHPNGAIGLSSGEEPLLFPLAIPLVAGPSTLTTLLLLTTRHPHNLTKLVLAMLLAWVASLLVLLSATFCSRWLNKKGLNALERLMGLILVIIAIQMMLEGLRGYLTSVTT